MTTLDHYDRLFLTATAGGGLFLAGALNLALGRAGGRLAVRVALSLAVCGLAGAALSSLGRPALALPGAGLMLGVTAVVGLAGSVWVHRRAAALAAAVRHPGPRWGLLSVAGLTAVIGAVVAFDRADEAQSEQSLHEMELLLGRAPSAPSERVRAATDRGTAVVLREPLTPRTAGELTPTEEKLLRDTHLDECVIRHGSADDASNCHGWVFTGGRFLISGEDVELILRENEYAETNEPRPGDVAVYRNGGSVAHTALVRYVTEGQPVLVEGKWGVMGLFLHPVDKSPYGTEVTFYRSSRRGHLLVGVGGIGPRTGASAPPATISE